MFGLSLFSKHFVYRIIKFNSKNSICDHSLVTQISATNFYFLCLNLKFIYYNLQYMCIKNRINAEKYMIFLLKIAFFLPNFYAFFFFLKQENYSTKFYRIFSEVWTYVENIFSLIWTTNCNFNFTFWQQNA